MRYLILVLISIGNPPYVTKSRIVTKSRFDSIIIANSKNDFLIKPLFLLNFQINGMLKNIKNQTSQFCEMIQYDPNLSGSFAMVERGGCEFLTKALNAQTAGYEGLIILDNKNNTSFTRIVYGNNNRAYFIRIPVVFLLHSEAQIIKKLPPANYDVTLQNDLTDKFSPIWTTKNLQRGSSINIKEYLASFTPLTWIVIGKPDQLKLYLLFVKLP